MNVLAISVGNTRVALGRFEDGRLEASERIARDQRQAVIARVRHHWSQLDAKDAVAALASVVPAEEMQLDLHEALGGPVALMGEEVPAAVGIAAGLAPTTGIDRLLNAAAAWGTLKGACVVVDAGTAITIDFVDGTGILQGGAIAPGARMQLDALHSGTAALPAIALSQPSTDPFARTTPDAMLQGVVHGIRGMVQRFVERYAESFGAYPRVIATGGDARLLFEGDEIVESIDEDLTLRGIDASVRACTGHVHSPGCGCKH